MIAAPNAQARTIRNPQAQHRNACGREQAGTETRATNQPATSPTQQVEDVHSSGDEELDQGEGAY
jgi:hypothetical protein